MKQRFFIPKTDRILGDRYELLESLGDGSYGWVWRAQRLSDNAIVAVKIPKEQGSRNRDLAEGEFLIGQEPHANVIEVYWMGRVPPEREWYAIEMEYFPSQTLARLLDEGEQGFVGSYSHILNVYKQVLSGVSHLHLLGISHGDIKPQNILVSGDRVKLTDFGCSVLPEEMYIRTRENGGTILYSAPEFAGTTWHKQKSADFFKGDIYSLGVLLYHLVTSRLPHDSLSQVVRHVPFPRPREINSSVCPALEEFILRCLPLQPEDRWESVSQMLEIFQRASRAQVEYNPVRSFPIKQQANEDWSTQAVRCMEEEHYEQAERVATIEFQSSQDPYAFLMLVNAAYKDKRFFDCIKEIESHPAFIEAETSVSHDLARIALKAYLETRQLYKAESMLARCVQAEGETLNLMLIKASILGSQAKYEEACQLLLALNRQYPQRLPILKRLVLVFEQLRDPSKAMAFLRTYARQSPDDSWAVEKLEKFSALGLC
jgi:eukaryotic-like serine/threonine-protein kinase